MRFLHISDLHIGKKLNNTDITADLEYVLMEDILGRIYSEVCAEKKPDGIIIAGDIYDKSIPSAEASDLFGRMLVKCAALKLPVYAISGNHDNAVRVAFGRELFSLHDIHISAPFSRETPVTLVSLEELDIALLPHITVSEAAGAFPEDGIDDMRSALEAVFRHAQIPRNGRPCVLAAHQAVGSGVIGMSDGVGSSVFEPFVYTALGHFHMPSDAGGDNIRYCGSPLCYSRNEAKRSPQKYVDVVDILPDGSCGVSHREIRPLRSTRFIEAELETLLGEDIPPSDDYLFITVTQVSPEEENIAERLRSKFPNIISIEFKRTVHSSDISAAERMTQRSFSENFSDFYKQVMHTEADEALIEAARSLFEEAEEAFRTGRIDELLDENSPRKAKTTEGENDNK